MAPSKSHTGEHRKSQKIPELPALCILAGGLGTRLGQLGSNLPKAMIEVSGRPFVDHQLAQLARSGVTRIVMCVGHLGQLIEQYLGARRWGMTISYSHDGPGLDGTLGAIRRALPLLGERFFVTYGDTFLRMDYGHFYEDWAASELLAGLAVYRNENRLGHSNAILVEERVVSFSKRTQDPRMRWIDYGASILDRRAVDEAPDQLTDLADLYSELARAGQLFGFEVCDRFYEVGTSESLKETARFLEGYRPTSGAQS